MSVAEASRAGVAGMGVPTPTSGAVMTGRRDHLARQGRFLALIMPTTVGKSITEITYIPS